MLFFTLGCRFQNFSDSVGSFAIFHNQGSCWHFKCIWGDLQWPSIWRNCLSLWKPYSCLLTAVWPSAEVQTRPRLWQMFTQSTCQHESERHLLVHNIYLCGFTLLILPFLKLLVQLWNQSVDITISTILNLTFWRMNPCTHIPQSQTYPVVAGLKVWPAAGKKVGKKEKLWSIVPL